MRRPPAPARSADDLVAAHFGGTLVCQSCGLIGEGHVHTGPTRRWAWVECLCGAVLAYAIPPPVLVPFGWDKGLPIGGVEDVTWLHDKARHPWVIAACCARLRCLTSHAPTFTEYFARMSTRPYRPRRRDGTP